MRTPLALLLVFCASGESDARGAVFVSPPSSLQPETTKATVHVKHTHRIAQSCTPEGRGSDLRCPAVFGNADASTSLRLIPVKARRLRGQRDEREPIEVNVGAEGVPEGGAVSVPPGRWEVAWSGYQPRKAFAVDAEGSVRVLLETTTGRCEKMVLECVLTKTGVVRRIEVGQ